MDEQDLRGRSCGLLKYTYCPSICVEGWVKVTKNIIHIKTEKTVECANPQINNIDQFHFNGKNSKYHNDEKHFSNTQKKMRLEAQCIHLQQCSPKLFSTKEPLK